jgi:ectoine hydroxylase-related dioxygenase (phytanoyl-CoA dioxygenase family)
MEAADGVTDAAGTDPPAVPVQAAFELETFGFTVLESVISADRAARLAELLDRADEDAGTDYTYDGAYSRHVANLPARADEFLALVDHPVVLALVESVLGPDVVLGSMNARIVRPGDPAQGLHADIPAVHRRLVGPPIMLQAVWMLDGFTADNGATCLVPGSHRAAGSAPPPGVTVPYVVGPTGPAGSVMVFDGQCWHGGGANRSTARRRAVFAHYRVGPWMRFQTDPTIDFPADRWDRMTDRQRQLLRMVHGVAQRNAADYYPEQFSGTRYD